MKKTNRILSVILALMLCIGMIPMTAAKAAEPVSADYILYLEEGKVHKAKRIDIPDGGAILTPFEEITGSALTELGITGSFEDGAYVYTFNNVNFSTTEDSAIELLDSKTVIKLTGDNTVKSGEVPNGSVAISAYCGSGSRFDLTITGDGTLTAISGKSTGVDYTTGIHVDGSLTIDGTTVKAVASDSRLSCFGIRTDTDFTIRNSTVISIADSLSCNYDSAGITVRYADLKVSNSTVIAIGGKTLKNSYGIFARADEPSKGNITAENSVIVAKGGDCDSSYGIRVMESCDIETSTVYMQGNKAVYTFNNENAINTAPTTTANMGAIAGTAADGTGTSKLTDWKGDGLDVISTYKYMILSPVALKEKPTASRGFVGKTLSDSTLTGGVVVDIDDSDVQVPGTFTWFDGTEVFDAAGTAKKTVLFTPDDTVNYSGYLFNVEVPVVICDTPSGEHDYTDLQKNETEHWYICSVCGAEKPDSREAHQHDSILDPDCNVCGMVRETSVFTVTFDPNGGTVVPETAQTESDGTLASLPTPTRDGHVFDGWYDANDTEVTTETVFTVDTTIKAKWLKIPTAADFVFTPPANLTYDGTEKEAAVTVKEGVTGMGAVTVKYEPTEKINADTYTVKIDVDEGTDYASVTDITYADWTFTITPAEPTVTPPTASRVRRGNALSTSTLTGGAAKGIDGTTDITGTFAWKDGTEVLNTRGTEQKTVVFTPDNTFTNYKAIEFNVDVEVYTPSSGGGGVSRYTVKFDTDGGSTIKNAYVTRNSKLTEPTAPTKEGYVFDGWYQDKDFTEKYDFESKVTKSFTLYAKWVSDWQNPFVDVDENDWYYENVKYVNENGLMKGTTETTFAPNLELTRGMFVTILYRLDGEPAVNRGVPFADVNTDDYFANAVIWGQQCGIISGVSETEFAPNANITREQMATILYRYAKYKEYDVSVGEDTNILSYDDAFDVSDYAYPALQWTCGAGLIKGRTETTLNPQDNATRAETAAILMRFIEGNVK